MSLFLVWCCLCCVHRRSLAVLVVRLWCLTSSIIRYAKCRRDGAGGQTVKTYSSSSDPSSSCSSFWSSLMPPNTLYSRKQTPKHGRHAADILLHGSAHALLTLDPGHRPSVSTCKKKSLASLSDLFTDGRRDDGNEGTEKMGTANAGGGERSAAPRGGGKKKCRCGGAGCSELMKTMFGYK